MRYCRTRKPLRSVSRVTKMYCLLNIVFALLATLICQPDFVAGKLIEIPRDTEVKVNHSIYFNCSTDHGLTAIFWFHGTNYVYTGRTILDPYHGRFDIERFEGNGTYTYNLVIQSVQPGDAGKYICAEDEGSGEQYSFQLIVFENDPKCQSDIQADGVIGQNVFNIPPDEVHLTCTLTYHGKIAPQMVWKKVGENCRTKDGVVSDVRSDNRLIYSLKLKGDISLENSSYVCQTTRSTQNQYKCTSENIKVLYFIRRNTTQQTVVRGGEISCIASNNTFPCIRQWYQGNYTCPLSCDETITAHLLGEYLCTVRCAVRGRDYTFEVLKTVVVEPTTLPPTSTTTTESSPTMSIIISVSVTLVVAVAFIFVFCWLRIKKRQRLADAVESIPLIPSVPDIFGIAVLGKEVFISRQKGHTIEVYNSVTFDFKRNIEVHGMTNPENIVACSFNKCLYIFDWDYLSERNAILKIDPIEGKLIRTWDVFGRGGRLSVADDTNVILNVNYEAILKEYSADGTLIREIDLGRGTGIFRTWHAIKLLSGHFVITQGDEGDPIRRVCILSTEEFISTPRRIDVVKVLKTFDGGSINRVLGAGFLSVDKKGSIMIADQIAMLLSSDLGKAQIIASKEHGLDKTWRACFDESNVQWLVTDYHRVLVCRVQDKIERMLYNLDSHYREFVLG